MATAKTNVLSPERATENSRKNVADVTEGKGITITISIEGYNSAITDAVDIGKGTVWKNANDAPCLGHIIK